MSIVLVAPLCTMCSCVTLHFSAPAFAMDMSNATQGTASSSSSEDPKGPKDGGSLEFEAEMIDADVINVESPEFGVMESRL